MDGKWEPCLLHRAEPHPDGRPCGIKCRDKTVCYKCGWNPVVDALRREQEQVWIEREDGTKCLKV